jgi:hypothetical protein
MPIPPEECEPDAKHYKADVYQHKSRTDWFIEIAVLFMVAGTLIATGYAARYTGQQAEIARDNENRQVRAYVSLRDIRFEKRNDDTFDIIPQWENTGNSETVEMQAYLSRYISDVRFPKGFTNGDMPSASERVPIILSPRAVSSTNFDTISKSCLLQFNRRDGVSKFYLWGWARYGDTLTSDQHVTRFCWDIDQIIFLTDGQVSRVSHNLCTEGNCAERDCAVPTENLAIAVRQNVCKDASPTAPPPAPPTKQSDIKTKK